jgi:palmitoyl-protein thioesterase
MGFSQGGLYLRHYAQYCDGPPIRNCPKCPTWSLADKQFGTPHFGISALLPCPTPPTLSCILAARAARVGIYTTYAQTHLVQAQYYRDAERLDQFMEMNEFLMDLNAEKKGSDEKLTYGEKGGEGLSGLENLVAIMFDADRTSCSILNTGGTDG